MEQVSVALAKAFRNLFRVDVNGCEIGSCSIVAAKPQKGANLVWEPAAGLAYEPEARLLGGDCALVYVRLAIDLK